MPERSHLTERQRVVGIMAGGGSLPAEVAASLKARGIASHIIAIEGEADGDLGGYTVTRIGWGGIGVMIESLKRAGASELIFIGKVRRPDLMRLRPDLGFLLALPELAALIMKGGGDDTVLRSVARFFERRGIKVVGPREAAPDLIVGRGALGRVTPDAAAGEDIALGLEVVGRLARFDIGQGVVVSEGRIEAIEASENTDRMLERVGLARRLAGVSGAARKGVIVKRPKPGQDTRIDLPGIGPETILRAADASLAGVAVEAGGAIAARRTEMIQRADTAGLFVAGVEAPRDEAKRRKAAVKPGAWQKLTRRGARARDIAEAETGCGIARVLADYDAGRAVVIARAHVLAVEAGEGAVPAIARAAGERQWGAQGTRRSAGVVLLHGLQLTAEIVAATRDARLRGIAMFAGQVTKEAIAAADEARLFVIARTWERVKELTAERLPADGVPGGRRP